MLIPLFKMYFLEEDLRSQPIVEYTNDRYNKADQFRLNKSTVRRIRRN